ncbi:synaptic vesicle membrane protein VAT-1 homolog-like isoform X1 [Varroa jacobsoni]|uniref:synaptic vesicle membrane protein VAT-1 homolog-like isoform X1 n=1 Tax=Varroa jacobsoni TaxID=62625 RepID=UPI000BF3D71D|nr:synaptic vesicle membrane protein VAT-1 homolog-like isoform X1 [Varroa jacobsoni]
MFSGLNFLDLMTRLGAIDNLPKAPFTMGCELAGVVEAVGEKVESFVVGQRVCAISDMKAWAELVAVPAKHCYPIPDGVSYQDAAALLVNYTVAHALLFDVANLCEGQIILIHSIGGGVGQALAQLSKMVPDVTVIGTASKAKHEQLKDVCQHLLERESCYVTQVKKIAESGVDLVLDCSCGEDVNKGYALLKPMGRYVLYGTSFFVSGETKNLFSFAKSWWQVDRINPIKLYDDNKSISGFNLRHLLFQQGQHEYVARKVQTVFELFKASKISPVIDSVWAFEDIAEAMQKMHDRRNLGKLLLDPAQAPKPRPAEPEKPVKVGRKESKKEKRNKEKKEADKENGDKKDIKDKKDEKTEGDKDKKENGDAKDDTKKDDKATTNGEAEKDGEKKE